ncbi:MAG TPA: AAA family ATPase [Pyrinomonadaceae bacterium]|nr:AAA family ATPase [Pyrinomonadaceae bacterium]
MLPSNPDKPKINPRQMVKDRRADELYSLICSTGYIPDKGNFSDFCQSLLSGFALLGCGEPGAGKTVFSDALYEACNLDYYTVSGRDELKQEELLCAWDKDEQESFMRDVRLSVESLTEVERTDVLESARQQRWTKRFLILGEVAAAYSKAQESGFPTLLRLDEADKFGASVEDALLSPLATGKIYVERLAEGFVGCTNPDFLPIVISTSNDSRHELSLPFRDRHLHTYFATPNLTKELEILRARCPEIRAANLSNALKLLDAIRSVAGISHFPSIRTGIQLARAFERDDVTEINETNVPIYFTYFAKNRRDAEYLKKQLPYLLSCVQTFHPQIDALLVEGDEKWAKYWGKQGMLDGFLGETNLSDAPIDLDFLDKSSGFYQNSFPFNSVI